MKYSLILFGILILLIIAFLVLTAPTVKSLSSCLDEYNLKMDNNISIARQERWNKEMVCRNGKPAIVSLQSCYNSVSAQSILPLNIVFSVAKIIRPSSMGGNIKEAIKMHNSSCSDYPDAQVL